MASHLDVSESRRSALIQSKLAVPPLGDSFVARPRLDRLVGSLVESQRVVVVSATAGAGKTSAMAAASSELNRPTVWLTVDRTDAAPGRLVSYLEAALTRELPALESIATAALASGLAHAEAAGMLVEAAGDHRMLLVIDNLERLGESADAWAVIESVVRYAPKSLTLALITRRSVPTSLCELPSDGIATVGDAALAFSPTEAEQALGLLGHAVDAEQVVRATGGWVAGVIFEGWRVTHRRDDGDGRPDPLFEYLSDHILARLDEAEREFLITTSILDEVTASSAARLGILRAGEGLEALRRARLPVAWLDSGRTMRCYPRFREYLLDLLERGSEDEVRPVRIAHSRLLAEQGHDEDATEGFLRAGALEDALQTAERAIVSVIERLDFRVAERWLERLEGLVPSGASDFAIAELMLALARDDYARGVGIYERLRLCGELEDFAASSERAATLLAWSVGMIRPSATDELDELLDRAPQGPAVAAVRYALCTVQEAPIRQRPDLIGGPTDALLLAADYAHGRLAEIIALPGSRWVSAVVDPWRIAALRVLGHTSEALERYRAATGAGIAELALSTNVGPELLLDAGEQDEARRTLARGRELALASGSAWARALNRIAEAKVALRCDRDPRSARDALDELDRDDGVRHVGFIAELIDTWYGFALLLSGDDRGALLRLRAAVTGMVASDRILELPTAATYLAEAYWRAGDDEAADQAAELALAAAQRHGSNHLLIQALRDFPAVVTRGIDAQRGADTAWHSLGRALNASLPPEAGVRVRQPVRLTEFGAAVLEVDGVQVRARLAKTYELLALLGVRPGRRAEREELLDALFAGRNDGSTRAYLRQLIQQLRRSVPGVGADASAVWLEDTVEVSLESQEFEVLLGEASRLQGSERLESTLAALALADRGDYLPGARSEWAEARRAALRELVTSARVEAAQVAFECERYLESDRLIDRALREDPLGESAWRLKMRIASALGDDDAVLAAYSACELALAGVGTAPAASTQSLLSSLRR